eukprot:6193560-Pleurochrysis_carterae.AAC.3
MKQSLPPEMSQPVLLARRAAAATCLARVCTCATTCYGTMADAAARGSCLTAAQAAAIPGQGYDGLCLETSENTSAINILEQHIAALHAQIANPQGRTPSHTPVPVTDCYDQVFMSRHSAKSDQSARWNIGGVLSSGFASSGHCRPMLHAMRHLLIVLCVSVLLMRRHISESLHNHVCFVADAELQLLEAAFKMDNFPSAFARQQLAYELDVNMRQVNPLTAAYGAMLQLRSSQCRVYTD